MCFKARGGSALSSDTLSERERDLHYDDDYFSRAFLSQDKNKLKRATHYCISLNIYIYILVYIYKRIFG